MLAVQDVEESDPNHILDGDRLRTRTLERGKEGRRVQQQKQPPRHTQREAGGVVGEGYHGMQSFLDSSPNPEKIGLSSLLGKKIRRTFWTHRQGPTFFSAMRYVLPRQRRLAGGTDVAWPRGRGTAEAGMHACGLLPVPQHDASTAAIGYESIVQTEREVRHRVPVSTAAAVSGNPTFNSKEGLPATIRDTLRGHDTMRRYHRDRL